LRHMQTNQAKKLACHCKIGKPYKPIAPIFTTIWISGNGDLQQSRELFVTVPISRINSWASWFIFNLQINK
jgi:hypothetical protein